MFPAAGLYGHIRNNNFKSTLLLVGFVVLVAVIWLSGTLVWAVIENKFSAIVIRLETYREPTELELLSLIGATWMDHTLNYAFVPVILVAGWFGFAYAAHARLIRRATGAHGVSRTLDTKLYNMVENLTIACGMPMPKIEIMETPALNAYASGLSPKSATVAVTRGLLETLNDQELEAVLAHEITHIRNRDVRLMVIATIFVGVLAFASEMMRRPVTNAGGIGRSLNGLELLVVIAAVAIAALASFFGVLTHFALSRSREYLADAGSAELTKNPDALISALQRIAGHDEIEGLPSSMRAMMISSKIAGLFSTHPAVEDRIEALQRYAGGRRSERPTMPARAAQACAGIPAAAATGFGRRGVAAAAGAAATMPAARSFGRRAPR